MKNLQIITILAALFSLVIQVNAALEISSININIYTPATDTGSSITFGSLIDSFSSPDIHFGLWNSVYWDPVPGVTTHDNGVTWGADITGSLTVDTAGDYAVNLISDDGSYLFLIVNGSLALRINNGGDHGTQGPTVVLTLNAGDNPFELQYRENGIGGSGVWLTPEPLPTEPRSRAYNHDRRCPAAGAVWG